MKAIVNKDPRSAIDRRWDEMFEELCRKARLDAKQRYLVKAYEHEILNLKIHETEGAVEMSYMLALIQTERYGTTQGAKRLNRVQRRAVELINDAYGKGCIDAQGRAISYDGCGFERLQNKLKSCGIQYEGDVL